MKVRLTKTFPGLAKDGSQLDGLVEGVELEVYPNEKPKPGHVWVLTPGGYMRDGKPKLGRFVELAPGEFEVIKTRKGKD